MVRIFRHYVPKSLVILGTSEAIILFGSIYLGVTIGFFDLNPTDKLLVGHIWTKALSYTLIMMLVMVAMGLYERGLRDGVLGVFLRIGMAFFLGLSLIVSALSLFPAMSIGANGMTIAFLCSAAGVLLFRTLIYRFAQQHLFLRRVLILGAGEQASQLERLRRNTDWRGVLLVGYVHIPGENQVVHDRSKILQKNASLLQLALEHYVDEIVVAIGNRRACFPINEILDCKMRGIQVVDLVTFFEQLTGKIQIDALNPSSMIFADGFIQAVLKGYVHRSFDAIVSFSVLMLMWPVMLVTAFAIWLESAGKGPIFYKQVRVGRNGKPFPILKFRSMRVDAEKSGEAQWATTNDSRITRVGALIRKIRIDELPQLLNVLKGDMSFVGPRPERPEFVDALVKTIPYYNLRHRVNPGITGWAQICYPYGASEEDAKEKLQYDLYYIKNYSLFLDLMILIQTAQVILWGKGAR